MATASVASVNRLTSRRTLTQPTLNLLERYDKIAASTEGLREISNTSYSSSEDEKIVDIPEYVTSLQTVSFLGFEESRALRIWDEYLRAVSEQERSGGLEHGSIGET